MIALTGATGFLGRRVARVLAAEGHAVRCLVRDSSDTGPLEAHVGPALVDRIEIVRVDLLKQDDCRDALAACDALVHAAAGLSGAASTLFLNSVSSTKSLLSAAAEVGLRRVVLISSLGVYAARGVPSGGVLTEDTPVDPDPPARDPYTYAKLVQEREARRISEDTGLPIVTLRPGIIIGPGRGVLCGRIGIQLGRTMVQMGGGQIVANTYVDNCAEAIALAVTANDVEGRVLNIIDDDLPTASQSVRFSRRLDPPLRRVWVPGLLVRPACGFYHWYSRLSHGQVPPILTRYRAAASWGRVRYDNSAAKAALGWTPRVPMDEAMRRSVTGEDPAAAPADAPRLLPEAPAAV